MIPSTPMKRVSRPARMAFIATKTSESARPSAPGSPSSDANRLTPPVLMSLAASTVCRPSRKSLIAALVPNAARTVEMA